ncbi:hybrid sensor histidine kinase/response regulator transcription factor [Winogradskyella marina]|nr:hybrid sensor histidine kinase/response regulator transcription factor [Winogradskyella marina]
MLFIAIAFAVVVNAQESVNEKPFSFNSLTINDGLSQSSVISIAQDSIGYLWLATQDGLNKYNGRSFKHYDKQFEDITRPTFSRLGKIYIDKQNQLWIITNSGKLERYNSKTDDFKSIERFKNVSAIFQDESLNIFVGTYGEGLFKIDYKTKDTLQIFDLKDKAKTVYDFTETSTSLFVTTSGSVFEFETNKPYKSLKVNTHNNANFSSIVKDKNGNAWLGSFGQGLYFKDKNKSSFEKYEHSDLPADLNIEDLLIDSKNRLWIATYGNGAYVLNNNILKNFKANKNNPFAMQYNDVLCLYKDVTDIIWLGTDGAGANYFDEHLIKFNVLTNNQVPKTVNVDVVRSISTDKDDNLWVGTSGKGLTYINFTTNDYKTFTTKNSGLSSNRIISLAQSDNTLWIGHQGFGLNIKDAAGQYTSFPEISNFTIWRIVRENNTQSWLCTEQNGLVLFDIHKGIIEQYNISNSLLTTNDIKTVVKGDSTDLWIGSENNGLYKLNTKTNQIINIATTNSKIKSLYFKDHILWVGTNGKGLKKYNTIDKTLKTFDKTDGLPNNVIYGILPDNDDNLWLSTNYGISKFTYKNDNKFKNYSKDDGLQSLEFNTGAYYTDINGILYFGGLEGLNWLNPNQITFNTIKPKTIITKFEVYSKEQALEQNKAYEFNKNTVTFTFSSLHFSQPSRNLYKYQLENYDTQWIEAENNNTAHYTNLPPNDYTFKVISSNYDGVWNTIPATYSFTIKQPWYLSKIAIIGYILLFIISSYLLYTYLKWRWHIKMQLQYKNKETERLKKLDEFKTRIYTNISHEFRTPLTLISGPVDKQLSKPNISKEDKKELTLVQNNAKRLLNLVNQMLDLSKLESGNLKLSVSKGNLNALLKQITSAFEFKANEKQINFTYTILPIKEAWYDRDVIEKITSNLLSNAIKYTPKNGKIHFETVEKNGQIIITVINNGNTISNRELSKLFQRYYQDNKNTDGMGIGLSLVKELAILSHGNIVAHTMNADEIQFTLTLPIERSFYSSSEITDEKLIIEQTDVDDKSQIEKSFKTSSKPKDNPILLIVEDDKDIREFVSSIFNESYTIIEASNGEIGIKKAIKYIPDIIISDLMMPKVDGIELCITLKSDEKTSHIPIIILTAKSGDKNEIKGLKTGADDYVVKPFNREKLKIRVDKLIELRQQLQKRYSNSLELKDVSTTSVEKEFISKLKSVLKEHITNPDFNSEQLSEKMLLSRMQLHRKLKALTGLTTTQLIRNERLKIAVLLLKESDLTISEIAYHIGYNTPSYFIKHFKAVYNSTPSEYLTKH